MGALVVRAMAPGDESVLIEMGQRMWEESDRFKRHPLSIEKLKQLANWVHTVPNVKCFVAEKDEIIGIWVGVLNPFWYSNDTLVSDIVFYVDKQYRGSSAAMRLVVAADTWAKEMGATENSIGLSSGIDTEKVMCFFEKMGYTHSASIMIKEMG